VRRRHSDYDVFGVNLIAQNCQEHANRDSKKSKDAEEIGDEGSLYPTKRLHNSEHDTIKSDQIIVTICGPGWWQMGPHPSSEGRGTCQWLGASLGPGPWGSGTGDMIVDVAVIIADILMTRYPVADFEISDPQYIFTEFCLNCASPFLPSFSLVSQTCSTYVAAYIVGNLLPYYISFPRAFS